MRGYIEIPSVKTCFAIARTDPRIVVHHDEVIYNLFLYEAHGTELRGHLGRKKTYGSVGQYYWWLQLNKWVSTYMRTCETF